MNNVKYEDTPTHLYVYNFPSAFGDTQNKNNRIYEWTSLKGASNQFNSVVKDNPYFGYLFDGHRDEDSYENVAGRVIRTKISEADKCILTDLKLNKGSKAFSSIKNSIADGDPIGISMRIISPNTLYLSKKEIASVNEGVHQLSDDNAGISDLLGKDEDIEYISGDAYLQRFDLTQFPSFNNAFIAKEHTFKSESALDKFKEYKQSSCLISDKSRCITDSCRFRHTIKDFIDLISKNESITNIKDNPDLYDDMLKFGYMNLSEFNFDSMTDRKYLSGKLFDFKLSKDDCDKQIETLDHIMGGESVLDYILTTSKIDSQTFVGQLNALLMATINVDEIFYQVISVNFIHWIILSSLLINGKDQSIVVNSKELTDIILNNVQDTDDNGEILANLIDSATAADIDIYNFTNVMFTYIYSVIDKYSDTLAPAAVVKESFDIFKKNKFNKLFKTSFVKK